MLVRDDAGLFLVLSDPRTQCRGPGREHRSQSPRQRTEVQFLAPWSPEQPRVEPAEHGWVVLDAPALSARPASYLWLLAQNHPSIFGSDSVSPGSNSLKTLKAKDPVIFCATNVKLFFTTSVS